MNELGKEKQFLLKSLENQGFSKDILKAFSGVKREDFVPKSLNGKAYENIALPLGKEQTISQPYTIAVMLSLLNLKKGQKILEIGSGCGYALALLSEIVGKKGKVFGVEIVKELYEKSKTDLKEYQNVKVYNQNGNFGLEEKKPFDRVLISARTEEIPKALVLQLKDRGLIVAPIGDVQGQSLICFRKESGELKAIKKIRGFVFVPLVG